MRINSVPDVKFFCKIKDVLFVQSKVRHFVRHPVCRSMEVVLFKGEASFGGSSKTPGVLEKWGLELTVNDWNTGAKKKRKKAQLYMWTGQPSVSGGTGLHGRGVRKKKDYFELTGPDLSRPSVLKRLIFPRTSISPI